jgi:oligopeptidase A
MAGSPENAENMVHQIFEKAFPKAQEEIETLKNHYHLDKLEPRDLAYYTRKYKEEVFELQEEKLKEYFEFDQVLSRLHSFVGKFFGIEIKKT